MTKRGMYDYDGMFDPLDDADEDEFSGSINVLQTIEVQTDVCYFGCGDAHGMCVRPNGSCHNLRCDMSEEF